ncbi:MAG: TIM barrel protein [Parasphingorhabdus sp.]|uniref:sugar phosphate isomerase/epimerase family protein n=1 Tax=Parasphingorhabdus sp. TaxID=2709688 RepID=UPI0032986770
MALNLSIHNLSLAAGTLPEFLPDQIAAAAGAAGFRHVGFTIEPGRWTAEQKRRTMAAISQYELSILDVEVIWIPEGGALTDDHRLIIEAGQELDADHVLVVSAEPDPERTAAALHQLCAWAAPSDMRICLEFLMITAVQTLDSALDIVTRCDHPAAGVLIDSLHFQRAGHDIAAIPAIDSKLLPYCQLCDGNLHCLDDFDSYLEDALDLRAIPGGGQLPIADLIAALPVATPFSLEVRSKALRDSFPDPVARAEAVFQQSMAYFKSIGISVR